MKDVLYTFDLLVASPQVYYIFLLGAALGAMLGILIAYLMWDRTCRAYEDDAIMHMQLTLRANKLRSASEHREAHLRTENKHLTAMLHGEEPDPADAWKTAGNQDPR